MCFLPAIREPSSQRANGKKSEMPSIAGRRRRLSKSSWGFHLWDSLTRSQLIPALMREESKVQGKRWAVSCAERTTCTSEGRRTIVVQDARTIEERRTNSGSDSD